MKKIRIMFIFVFMLFFIPTVYAGTAYVDSIDIHATINIDGSMTVTETILWDIEEDLNGLYRDVLIQNASNKINNAAGIVVDEVLVNGTKFNYSYTTLNNGDSGKYNINNIEGGKQIKIFTPSSNEYKTTTITYTLYDVVVKYNDIAELYWNFIGSGWDYGIDDVHISITLPGEASTLKVFAHGPLYGYSTIPSTDSVVLKVENLRSGEMVDARVLFDASLVDTTKIVDENVLESVLTKEAKLAEQANLKREQAKKALYISIGMVMIALMIPIIVYVNIKRKSPKATFKGKYYRELPQDYGPAIMNKVIHGALGTTSSYDMLATLLDLVRRKYVEIEAIYKEGKNKPVDYNLKLIKTDLDELNVSEKHFVQELIFVDTTEIALKELSKKNSKSLKAQNKAVEAYNKWKEKIEQVAKEKDLLKKENAKIAKDVLKCVFALFISIGVAIFGAVLNYEDILILGSMSLFLGIYELVFVILQLNDLRVRTQKGIEHKAMWKAFKNFLEDFSKLDEHDYKSIAIWEHYLVYATALGISKKVIKQLKIVFPTEFEQDSNMFSTYMTINLLSDSDTFSNFTSSFSSAATTAFSAPSSSSGSGGGFSGGAGGRRRRRWWWRILTTIKRIKTQRG
ncbi:MAG: DUF2207 domain-containing protein [Clostridia bacterium]|nr:DUF2207 domain-containing protein [Clostridia bacterium]